MPRQPFDIPFADTCRGHAAAVCARCAVDLFLDVFGHPPQTPVRMIVRFQVAAEVLVLRTLLLTHQPDLDQIVDHWSLFRVTDENQLMTLTPTYGRVVAVRARTQPARMPYENTPHS